MTEKKPTGLELLRAKFPENTISKLPKPTANQTSKLKAGMQNGDFSLGIRCKECGGWHHKDVVHLDYVGHAALTDRLLDCDAEWNWEPLTFDESGDPKFDNINGMWIKLTVCGVTRLGYGIAEGKDGGNAIKEVIGDALRNAAMRFGAALDLWHKGDLHADEEPEIVERALTITADQFIQLRDKIAKAGVDEAKIIEAYGVARLDDLKASDFDNAIARLASTLKANGSVKDDEKFLDGK